MKNDNKPSVEPVDVDPSDEEIEAAVSEFETESEEIETEGVEE